MGAAAPQRSGRQVELQRQHPRSRLHRRKGHRRRRSRAWYQEHIFKPLGMVDTSYAVAADKQSRLADQSQPRHRHDGRAAAEARRFRRRRRRRFAATAASTRRCRTTACSCGCCSTAARSARQKILSRDVRADDGREPDRRDLRRDAAGTPTRSARRPFPLGAGKDKFGLGFQIASNDPADGADSAAQAA